MLKSEARSGARIEYLSKVAKQEPQYEPPPSTSRTRSTHTSCAPSTRRSKTSRGGAPTYMKSKEKAGSFLNLSDVLLQEATAAGIIMKNPSAGQKMPRPGQAIMPQLESQADKKIRGVNPRFFSK